MEFKDKHPINFLHAYEITDELNIIAKLYDNMGLLEKLHANECAKFTKLTCALDSLDDSPDDNVLIHFADINLYCVFNGIQYVLYFETMDESANLYQIVPTRLRQKLVFECLDDACFAKLQDYAKNCFNADVHASRNQITVNVVNFNERETDDNYNRLCEYVGKQRDMNCIRAMKKIPVLYERMHKYRYYLFDGALQITNVMNINTTDRTQVTRNWIANNPPLDREITTDYYARYRTISDPVVINQFGKLVRNAGYKTMHGTNNRKWVK
jgi:hypothetical protein